MVYGRIYKITNTLNNKPYFGQTKQPPNRRWSQHKQAAKNGGKMILYNAIRLHGVENFTFEVVCQCETLDELNAKEIEYITINNSLSPNGYNAGKGGDNYEKTPETCAKLSASNKGRIISEEWRKNMSIAGKGRKITEETRIKMQKVQKGRVVTDETKQKLREANIGKKQSADTIAKKSAARTGVAWSDKKRESMMGRKNTEETKKKMSESQKGRVFSEKTKAKMREAKQSVRKVTEEQISEIRKNTEKLAQYELANKYNVSRQLISNIINYKRGYEPLV
jgi:group I intron endonuclease